MLSLLIPTHDYDCAALIEGLSQQGQALRQALGSGVFDFEILVFDDASTKLETVAANREALSRCGGRLIIAPTNVGAGHARNALARAARFPYLVFMDCDAALCSPDFLARYWADRERADVVCGAILNPPDFSPQGHELRYRYEKQAERYRSVAVRNQHPYDRFTVFNALIRRDVFLAILFDDRCHHYGYEDALFGFRLEDEGYTVLHTDNPLIHNGIDTNESFMRKTETALQTLHHLGAPLTERATVARWAHRLGRWRMAGLATRLFRLTQKSILRQLLGHRPSLLLLQFYKLGYYLTLSTPLPA